MRRSIGNYSYPYLALLSLLSLWKLREVAIRKGESVNNDKSAKGEKEIESDGITAEY